MFLSTVWAYLMPNVTNSIYFHNEKSEPSQESPPPVTNYTPSPGEPKTAEDIESKQSKTKVGNKMNIKLFLFMFII